MTAKQKNLITTIILVGIILGGIVAGVVYKLHSMQIYGNNGIYHSCQETGEYLQFKKDKTFSFAYNPDTDKSADTNVQAEILSKGTWEKNGNKITLHFEDSDNSIVFVEKNKYIYNQDAIFKGKTSDSKLLNNQYVLNKSDDRKEVIWFFDDGTVSHESYWGKDMTIKDGKYTRTDDILTVRYNETPDTAQRYLVLENGITKAIYSKELAQ